MSKFSYFYALISILFLISCGENKTTQAPKEDKVVLQVGDIKILQSEFEEILEQKKEEVEINEQKEVTTEMFDQWVDNFINRKVVEDFAVKQNYHTDEEILYNCSVYTKAYLVQPEGDYYKETILENADVDYMHVEKFKKDRFNGINLEYIHFETERELIKVLGKDTVCKTIEDYERIKEVAKSNEVLVQNITTSFPFQEFTGHREKLMHLKQGQVTRGLTAYNSPYNPGRFYIKCLGEGEVVDNGERYTDDLIWHWLQQNQCEYLFHQKLYNIYRESEMELNEDLINDTYSKLSFFDESLIIDTASIVNFLDSVALEYVFNEDVQKYTLRDFVKFYKALPIKRRFESQEDYREYFIDIVIYDYIEKEAIESNFLNKEQENDRQELLKMKMSSKLLDDSVYSVITVSDDDVFRQYEKDSALYTFPRRVSYSTLLFRTYEDAYAIYDSLAKHGVDSLFLKDTDIIAQGVVDAQHGTSIELDTVTGNNQYAIFKVRDMTQIVKTNEMFSFAVKTKEEGSIRLQFDEVKQTLRNKTTQEKYKFAKLAFAQRLKEQIVITNNIKYSDYF